MRAWRFRAVAYSFFACLFAEIFMHIAPRDFITTYHWDREQNVILSFGLATAFWSLLAIYAFVRLAFTRR